MNARDQDTNWVSPYLQRPLRSLEEVLAERQAAEARPEPVATDLGETGLRSTTSRGTTRRQKVVKLSKVVRLQPKVA